MQRETDPTGNRSRPGRGSAGSPLLIPSERVHQIKLYPYIACSGPLVYSAAMVSRGISVSIGDRYGSLTVLSELPTRKLAGGTKRWFRCRCDCGAEMEVRLGHLRSGHTRSCGCLVVPARGIRHGMYGSPEYNIWEGMRDRCYRPKTRGYANYGGRGIRVCDRWRESFEAFYEDMGPRPSPEHQLDRIEGDKGYEPGNCRWATRAEQNRNRKDNVVLEFRGERMCLTDWAKRSGMSKGTLRDRLARGMSIEEALTTPVRQWTKSNG